MIHPVEESRWRRRKEARPAELVAAAIELFVEKGFAATRLEEIAARAGVSKGTVYLYFSSKEDLFKAAVREGVVPHLAEVERLIEEDTGSVADLLRNILLNAWHVSGDSPVGGLPKLLVAEARNFPVLARFYYDEVISRSTRLFIVLLERGIARGEFRPFDVKIMERIILAPFLMHTIWRHSLSCCEASPLSSEHYATEAIELILRGLRADKPVGQTEHTKPKGKKHA